MYGDDGLAKQLAESYLWWYVQTAFAESYLLWYVQNSSQSMKKVAWPSSLQNLTCGVCSKKVWRRWLCRAACRILLWSHFNQSIRKWPCRAACRISSLLLNSTNVWRRWPNVCMEKVTRGCAELLAESCFWSNFNQSIETVALPSSLQNIN